jgi:hypothetical protein
MPRMLSRLPGLILLALFLFAARAGAADGYVSGFEDLPLAPGLVSVPDAGIAFDNPTGRIVVAYARGAVAKSAVEKFYNSTLPQLGWAAETPKGSYLREGERLTIEVLGKDGAVTVRYSLAPK